MTSNQYAVAKPGAGARSSGPDGDASQRPKRARTSRPKVKTGCANCKKRRIKCSEQRPECIQCVKRNMPCGGYPPPSRGSRPFGEIRIAPKPQADTVSLPTRGSQAPQPMSWPLARIAQRRPTPPPTPILPRSSMVLYSPSGGLPFNEQEGMYFQLFREQTAGELSGFFDSVFWTKSVLRECHNASAIRHAVVALGALYKTLEKSTESPPGSPSSSEHDADDNAYKHWEVAVTQYSAALRTLMGIGSQDTRMYRTRLMASVLLTCFDSFVGAHKQAIKQIQTGLGLLEQLHAERRQAFAPKPEEPVEQELVQMFTRLAIQAKSYDMAFHFPQPYVIRLNGASGGPGSHPASPASTDGASPPPVALDPIPERFASLVEARIAWDTLEERALRFTETLFSQASSDRPMGVLPASMKQLGTAFKDQVQAWSDAFDHILATRTAPGVSSQEKAGIAVLKMSQVMGQVLFLMTFSDSEMQFDAFLPHFRAIVDLALEVVGDEERRAAAKRCPGGPESCPHRQCDAYGNQSPPPDIFGGHEYSAYHIKPSFSADLGIVPPLYVVATKCRDPMVRRQAIQLLRSSARREGMWDSELTARIGMWITEIEEEEDHTTAVSAAVADAHSYSHVSHNHPHPDMLTPDLSPVVAAATAAGAASPLNFGEDVPLGPGGNARWDAGRESFSAPTLPGRARWRVPEERRIMLKAVDFDLRDRWATLQCGSRHVTAGSPDMRTRVTSIRW